MTPAADIYVARVFERSSGEGCSTVAAALNYAVDEWNVDIICMSFGFWNSTPQMNASLHYAASKDKLMFAAAANDGGNIREAMFPARHPNVFCIHATNSHGAWQDFNPPFSDTDYSTLGVDVNSAWLSRRGPLLPGNTPQSTVPTPQTSPELTKRLSGTSVAAAIAAGTVALILEFARIPALFAFPSYKPDERDLDKLQTFEGMKRVLDGGCTHDASSRHKYIAPWLFITADLGSSSIVDDDDKADRVAAERCWNGIQNALYR